VRKARKAGEHPWVELKIITAAKIFAGLLLTLVGLSMFRSQK
jgi:hypothetical protein